MVFFHNVLHFALLGLFTKIRVSRCIGTIESLPKLDVNAVADSMIQHAGGGKGKAALLLDVDGTIRSHLDTSKHAIKPKVKTILEAIGHDKGYSLVIISGQSHKSLMDTYEDVPNIAWYSEHGAFYKAPHSKEAIPIGQVDLSSWYKATEEKIAQILKPEGAKMASDKTGSFSFVNLIPDKTEEFQEFYRKLKSELDADTNGAADANEKRDAKVTLHDIPTLIEITHKDVNKGHAVDHFFKNVLPSPTIALAAGDDDRDAEMHKQLLYNMKFQNAYSVIINDRVTKSTEANHQLSHYHEFLRFLAMLKNINESIP